MDGARWIIDPRPGHLIIKYWSNPVDSHEFEQPFNIRDIPVIQNCLHQQMNADIFFIGFTDPPEKGSVVMDIFFYFIKSI